MSPASSQTIIHDPKVIFMLIYLIEIKSSSNMHASLKTKHITKSFTSCLNFIFQFPSLHPFTPISSNSVPSFLQACPAVIMNLSSCREFHDCIEGILTLQFIALVFGYSSIPTTPHSTCFESHYKTPMNCKVTTPYSTTFLHLFVSLCWFSGTS